MRHDLISSSSSVISSVTWIACMHGWLLSIQDAAMPLMSCQAIHEDSKLPTQEVSSGWGREGNLKCHSFILCFPYLSSGESNYPDICSSPGSTRAWALTKIRYIKTNCPLGPPRSNDTNMQGWGVIGIIVTKFVWGEALNGDIGQSLKDRKICFLLQCIPQLGELSTHTPLISVICG